MDNSLRNKLKWSGEEISKTDIINSVLDYMKASVDLERNGRMKESKILQFWARDTESQLLSSDLDLIIDWEET